MTDRRTSVTHVWADEARTVVKRTTVDYPSDLAELQQAIDEAKQRLAGLPEPEAYPSKEDYERVWKPIGWTFEEVCLAIDKRNEDSPDIQERLQLLVSIEQWQQDIADWRAKVG